MTQAGKHTWDIVIDYRQCPKCGNVNECRNIFQLKEKNLEQEILCSRCAHNFVITKKRPPTFAPLFGVAQPPEFFWD